MDRNKRNDLMALLEYESHWKRKHTIAVNKLAKVRKLINEFAVNAIRTKRKDK